MIGFGISTRNRREEVLACLAAVHKYADQADEIVICDDASDDGTQAALKPWEERGDGPKVQLLWNPQQVGVAGTKFRIVELLLLTKADEIILIEDDVLPTAANWHTSILDTAHTEKQAHLLYLPTNWKYGVTLETTGRGRTQIEWKIYCSGLIMYFRASLLRKVGNFDKRFGKFGYEHNELTSRCLVAQGLNPVRYPHCKVLEAETLVQATDVLTTRPKMAYHEVAQFNKDMQYKMQLAHQNKPLYDGLMQVIKADYQVLEKPGAPELREQFFDLAKVDG